MELKIKELTIKYCAPMLNGEVVVAVIDKLLIKDNLSKVSLKFYAESDENKERGFIYGVKDNLLNIEFEGNPFSATFLSLIKEAFKVKYNLTNQDFV